MGLDLDLGVELRPDIPLVRDFDLTGLDLPPERLDAATAIDLDEWRVEFELQAELFNLLAASMPRTLSLQRELLMSSIDVSGP